VHEKWLKLQHQARQGPIATSVPKLGEFLVYWREEVVRSNLAPATYVNYVTPGAEQVRELLDEDTILVVSHWEFTGVGYLTTGDTALALSAASRARERRQTARDAAWAA
jgi:hypothetical protein